MRIGMYTYIYVGSYSNPQCLSCLSHLHMLIILSLSVHLFPCSVRFYHSTSDDSENDTVRAGVVHSVDHLRSHHPHELLDDNNESLIPRKQSRRQRSLLMGDRVKVNTREPHHEHDHMSADAADIDMIANYHSPLLGPQTISRQSSSVGQEHKSLPGPSDSFLPPAHTSNSTDILHTSSISSMPHHRNDGNSSDDNDINDDTKTHAKHNRSRSSTHYTATYTFHSGGAVDRTTELVSPSSPRPRTVSEAERLSPSQLFYPGDTKHSNPTAAAAAAAATANTVNGAGTPVTTSLLNSPPSTSFHTPITRRSTVHSRVHSQTHPLASPSRHTPLFMSPDRIPAALQRRITRSTRLFAPSAPSRDYIITTQMNRRTPALGGLQLALRKSNLAIDIVHLIILLLCLMAMLMFSNAGYIILPLLFLTQRSMSNGDSTPSHAYDSQTHSRHALNGAGTNSTAVSHAPLGPTAMNRSNILSSATTTATTITAASPAASALPLRPFDDSGLRHRHAPWVMHTPARNSSDPLHGTPVVVEEEQFSVGTRAETVDVFSDASSDASSHNDDANSSTDFTEPEPESHTGRQSDSESHNTSHDQHGPDHGDVGSVDTIQHTHYRQSHTVGSSLRMQHIDVLSGEPVNAALHHLESTVDLFHSPRVHQFRTLRESASAATITSVDPDHSELHRRVIDIPMEYFDLVAEFVAFHRPENESAAELACFVNFFVNEMRFRSHSNQDHGRAGTVITQPTHVSPSSNISTMNNSSIALTNDAVLIEEDDPALAFWRRSASDESQSNTKSKPRPQLQPQPQRQPKSKPRPKSTPKSKRKQTHSPLRNTITNTRTNPKHEMQFDYRDMQHEPIVYWTDREVEDRKSSTFAKIALRRRVFADGLVQVDRCVRVPLAIPWLIAKIIGAVEHVQVDQLLEFDFRPANCMVSVTAQNATFRDFLVTVTRTVMKPHPSKQGWSQIVCSGTVAATERCGLMRNRIRQWSFSNFHKEVVASMERFFHHLQLTHPLRVPNIDDLLDALRADP
jgi:PRELI-like family